MEDIISQMTEKKYIDSDYYEVLKVQEGDNSAFDVLMFRYQEIIARQMRRFSTRTQVIEELTQNVFVNAFQSINNYRPQAPFLHWLRTIASRVGYNYWREEAKRPKTVTLEDWDQRAPAGDSKTDNRPDAGELLEKVLGRLPPKERQVLCMLYLDKMSTREISEIMGWTVPMVKMRAYRSRKKLKELLNDKELGEMLHEYR